MNTVPAHFKGEFNRIRHILLADDDVDDCFFFGAALKELAVDAKLTSVHDGEKLMKYLHENNLPDILFLDLNMPRKNGLECLKEIQQNSRLKSLAVIAISTSSSPDAVKELFDNGVQHFIRKPNEFSDLKEAIVFALSLWKPGGGYPTVNNPLLSK